MMSSIRWVLLLLAVKIFPILGNVLLNDCNDETTETTNTTPFRIEIQGGDPGYYPSKLSWKVTGIRVGVVGQGEHPGGTDLYVENLCLDPNDCYIFDIMHYYNVGLTEDDDFFKIFYDGKIIFQGDEFSSSTGRSMNFGDGCPSIKGGPIQTLNACTNQWTKLIIKVFDEDDDQTIEAEITKIFGNAKFSIKNGRSDGVFVVMFFSKKTGTFEAVVSVTDGITPVLVTINVIVTLAPPKPVVRYRKKSKKHHKRHYKMWT